MLGTDLIKQLQTALGPKGITTDAHDMAPWLTDWRGRWTGRARALVSPASTAEVAEVVKLAASARVPLVPQGGNTSMVGGATPSLDGDALILSLRRMNKIRLIDPQTNVAVADAGVILANFHDAVHKQSRRFPLTLGGKGSATIGGLVSTNAGGTQVLRFGTMRVLTLGVEAVLPNGMIYDGLTPLKKDNRGYDISQLMIGAEGTLGIVTAAALRLVPAIVDRAAAWIGLQSPQIALRLLRYLETRTADNIESFEIVPADTFALVLKYIPNTRNPLTSPHAWHVLIEYVASDIGCDATAALSDLIATAMNLNLLDDAAIATNETQIAAFWHLRDSISEAERSDGPAMQHDISVPISAMPDFMIDAAHSIETEFDGVSASAFGHLGDGNVHFHVRAPRGLESQSWRHDQGERISRRVHDLVIAAKGSISAEHGIGQMKREELLRLTEPARLMALRAIKTAFDPLNIMNPGKLIALAHEPEVK